MLHAVTTCYLLLRACRRCCSPDRPAATGIFELLTGANEGAPPVNGDTPATTTQPAAAEPAGDTPAATAQPEPTTTQPATDTPADQPAGNDGANDNNNNDNGNNNDTPATTTTAPTTTGGAATNDKNDAAPSFGTLNPGPATGGATTGGNAPSGFAGAAKPLNAGEVTAGTPPVDAKNGSDAAQGGWLGAGFCGAAGRLPLLCAHHLHTLCLGFNHACLAGCA